MDRWDKCLISSSVMGIKLINWKSGASNKILITSQIKHISVDFKPSKQKQKTLHSDWLKIFTKFLTNRKTKICLNCLNKSSPIIVLDDGADRMNSIHVRVWCMRIHEMQWTRLTWITIWSSEINPDLPQQEISKHHLTNYINKLSIGTVIV